MVLLTLALTIPGSSTSFGSTMFSGRGELGGVGGESGEGEGEGGHCFECVELGSPFLSLPVTSFGGAIATNLTSPFLIVFTNDSAVARSTPISDVSLIERS